MVPQASGAHPRSRGENQDNAFHPVREYGSSPLTRGKLQRLLVGRVCVGLIPAHAGKTGLGWVLSLCAGAHPRSRGENPGPKSPAPSSTWLIPAHAGKTAELRSSCGP